MRAVKALAAEEVARGPAALAGKLARDATRPIAAAPPVQGLLQCFTRPNDRGARVH